MAVHTTPGHRSAAEYRFREDQADDITRVAAYHRRDFCLSVIWFSPGKHAMVHDSIGPEWSSIRFSNRGLGSLNQLPPELLCNVVLHMDMHAIFKFRQASIRARQLVDDLNQYRVVVAHGLNLLCALLRTRLAVFVSLSDFYEALCTESCALCGEFAGFMSLPTWTRCCFKCLQTAPETQVRSLASVRKQFHLTKAELTSLRPFQTLPGIYTMDESLHQSRVMAVSLHQAMLLARQQAPEQQQGQAARRRAVRERRRKYNFMASCALPYYDRRTGRVERGVSCAGCQLAFETGIIGARHGAWASEARDRVYSGAGFLEHFRWCEQAQRLWKMSEEGTRRPAELPEAARRGGFFSRRE